MKSLSVFVMLFVLAVACLAQNPPTNTPQFQVSMNFLGGTPYGVSAAMDSAFTDQFTTNSLLRADVVVMPSANYTGYFGGAQYNLAVACPLLETTTLNCGKFMPYVNAGIGIGRVQLGSNPVQSSIAGLIRTGANYDPSGAGKFTLNLYECGWGSFGSGARSAWFCQTGISFGLGSNALSTQAKIERMKRSEAKKMKKMAARAAKAAKS
jgi:hypothetical protein